MGDTTYRIVEVVGTSTEGVTEAINNGVTGAAGMLEKADWMEVVQIRGHIDQGQVAHFQVTMKIGGR